MPKPKPWEGPQYGTVSLMFTFPIGVGADARDAETVATNLLAVGVRAGVIDERTLIDEVQTWSRSVDAEQRRRRRRGCTVPVPELAAPAARTSEDGR